MTAGDTFWGTVFLLGLAVLLGLHSGSSEGPVLARFRPESVTQAVDLANARQDWQAGRTGFLDARSEQEFSEGHIPGAIRVGLDNSLSAPWRDLPRGQAFLVYCSEERCGASDRVAGMLMRDGFFNIRTLRGGFKAWKEAGWPVAR